MLSIEVFSKQNKQYIEEATKLILDNFYLTNKDDVKEEVSTGIYYLGRERILRISEYFLKKYEEDPNCDYRIQCCPYLSDDALDKIHVSGTSVFFDIGTKQGYDELNQYLGATK